MTLTKSTLAGLAIGLLSLAATSSASRDVWLATKARATLLTTEGLRVKDVDVAVAAGVVTLHGTVKTGAEKAKAGFVVSGLEGVTRVKNLMIVAPQAFGITVRISDEGLRRSIEAALLADQHLGGVKVASVENGVVLLEGTTVSLEEELRAIELVWSVPGVSRVASRIEPVK